MFTPQNMEVIQSMNEMSLTELTEHRDVLRQALFDEYNEELANALMLHDCYYRYFNIEDGLQYKYDVDGTIILAGIENQDSSYNKNPIKITAICDTINIESLEIQNIEEIYAPFCTKIIGRIPFKKDRRCKLIAPICRKLNTGDGEYPNFYYNNLEELYLPECIELDTNAVKETAVNKLILPKCKKLQSSSLAGVKTDILDLPECESLELSSFSGAHLGKINLPKCEIIPTWTFNEAKIDKVEFPEILRVDEMAFTNSSVRQVVLPKCREIRRAAFLGCTELRSIRIPNCHIIKRDAFRWCKNLRYIVLPRDVKIDDTSFEGCPRLQFRVRV